MGIEDWGELRGCFLVELPAGSAALSQRAHRDLLVSERIWGILKWNDLLKEKEQAMA